MFIYLFSFIFIYIYIFHYILVFDGWFQMECPVNLYHQFQIGDQFILYLFKVWKRLAAYLESLGAVRCDGW
jgi:hypothetical protein